MPQMSPLSWLTLFFYFLIIFMIFNSMNFYSFLYQTKKSSTLKKKININWKW
uniref:ATP synthase complex subunit 8 n=1 Tax=Xystrocera globosa TaxID=1191653 RepID=A0A5J6EFG9_9CUCU|nr:ATP synthase F0 subunit 8 [Xystrocera globosa]QEU57260.1 ATP synthase F0 subunit 8 [Xystrocera globosa]